MTPAHRLAAACPPSPPQIGLQLQTESGSSHLGEGGRKRRRSDPRLGVADGFHFIVKGFHLAVHHQEMKEGGQN